MLTTIVLIVGLILYFWQTETHPKINEVGRIMFAFGLLVFLIQWAPKLENWFR